MTLSPRSPLVWMLLAGAGSAAILLGALGFQLIAGLEPCPLCIWQRWPHVAGLALAVLGLALAGRLHRPLAALGALAMLTGAGIGLYHTGIERGWWEGPDTCTSANDVGAMTTDQLMSQIMSAPLVRCDEVTWDLFGLSLASLNALASLAFAALWLMALCQDSSSASQ